MTDHSLPIPPPPPPRTGPRAVVVVLGAVVVLLAGASVLAIVLFVGARDEHGLEVQRLDQTIRSLTEAEDRLAETESANDTVTGRISTLEAQNTELHNCADAAKDLIIALKADDDATLNLTLDRTSDNC